MPRKLTKKEFILKARKIHGKKYLYHGVDYKYSQTKVKIWCRKCKKFFNQLPVRHLSGNGCFECGKIKTGKGVKKALLLTVEKIVKRFKEKHGDKYDYSKVAYRGIFEKIDVYCNRCKKYFLIRPSDHLQGSGCRFCAIIKITKVLTKSVKQFEKEARLKHNNLYSYYQDYKNSHKNIKIFCRIHGVFKQTPNHHLKGYGCSKCAGSNTQNEIYDLVSKITKLKFEYNIYLSELQGLELDIYNKQKRLAIEYNGEQHYLRYRNNWGYFKIESILATQKRDKKKKRLCLLHNLKLIIIPCYEYKKLKTIKEKKKYLERKCQENNS